MAMAQARLNLSPQRAKLWQGYSASTSIDMATAHFEAKYHRSPSEVIRNGGALLLGPLMKAEMRGSDD